MGLIIPVSLGVQTALSALSKSQTKQVSATGTAKSARRNSDRSIMGLVFYFSVSAAATDLADKQGGKIQCHFGDEDWWDIVYFTEVAGNAGINLPVTYTVTHLPTYNDTDAATFDGTERGKPTALSAPGTVAGFEHYPWLAAAEFRGIWLNTSDADDPQDDAFTSELKVIYF